MAQTIGFGDLQDSSQQNQQSQQNAGGPQNQSNQNQNGYQQDSNQYKPQAYNQQKQGTGYTNIQRVVQANQPQQLAQAVAGNVQQAGQQARQGVQQAGQQFQQQTAANAVDTNANQQLVQNVLANPDQYTTSDQNNPNNNQGTMFSRLISGQYGGPTSLQDQSNLEAQVQSAQQMGQALGSAGGQIGLLQRTVGGPQYQQGQQNLDQLLLSRAQSPAIQQARQQALGLSNLLGTQEAGAQAQGQEMTNKAQAFGQGVQQQFGQAVTTQDAALQQQAKDAQSARDAQYQKTLADVQSGKINQQEADMLGLTAGTQVSGDMLSRIGTYLTENPDKATAQNVASTQDYAKMDALRKLAGQYSPQDAQALLQAYSGQNAKAGTYAGEQGVTGDKTGFQSALSSQMADYHSKLDPVQNQLTQAQEINSMVQERDRLGGVLTPAGRAVQDQISQKYPGAASGGFTRSDWANSLLQTAQKKFNDTQGTLQSAYGGLQGIQIIPENQPIDTSNIQTVGNLGLENMPKAT